MSWHELAEQANRRGEMHPAIRFLPPNTINVRLDPRPLTTVDAYTLPDVPVIVLPLLAAALENPYKWIWEEGGNG